MQEPETEAPEPTLYDVRQELVGLNRHLCEIRDQAAGVCGALRGSKPAPRGVERIAAGEPKGLGLVERLIQEAGDSRDLANDISHFLQRINKAIGGEDSFVSGLKVGGSDVFD